MRLLLPEADGGNMNRWKTFCLASAILATAIGASAQTVTTLAYYGDYFSRFSSFTQGRDGNLYGSVIDADYGHIVKITPSGALTVLHDFCPQSNCIAGSRPAGPLVLGTDGNFYGVLGDAGDTTGYCGLIFGCGTVFKMTPGGTVTVLHSFSGNDGSNPDWLIEGSDGNFYGTTTLGGGAARGFCGCGTIFKITPAGVFTTLHTFVQTDGDEPNGIMQATDGNLYGTTHAGGKLNRLYCQTRGCGTVFKVTTGGVFTSLHSFQVGDGALPYQPPVQASDGTFYGTTFEGANGGDGTLFSITSQGEAKTVYNFTGLSNYPIVGLVAASDGNLYGTTQAGGCVDAGYIYSVSQADVVSLVYDGNCQEGDGYSDALLQATGGKFYGSYTNGVESVLYSLDVGLSPFITFVIPSGKIGQTVEILGPGFTGTTNVTFNGVAAAKFTVVSDTYMTAVVPVGATSGTVVVTTPTGALTSNPSFTIGR
jgi:uncharacterized repeat protein (TIGR03803 family)